MLIGLEVRCRIPVVISSNRSGRSSRTLSSRKFYDNSSKLRIRKLFQLPKVGSYIAARNKVRKAVFVKASYVIIVSSESLRNTF